MKQNAKKPVEALKAALENVLDHHFGMHENCSVKWCPYLKLETEREKQNKLVYRHMDRDSKMYYELKRARAPYLTLESLKQCQHNTHTNKCENFMSLVATTLPKYSNLSGSVSGKARVFHAAGRDGRSPQEYYGHLFQQLGTEMSETTLSHLEFVDSQKRKWRRNHTDPEYMRKRAKRKKIEMNREHERVVVDSKNGYLYAGGVAV